MSGAEKSGRGRLMRSVKPDGRGRSETAECLSVKVAGPRIAVRTPLLLFIAAHSI